MQILSLLFFLFAATRSYKAKKKNKIVRKLLLSMRNKKCHSICSRLNSLNLLNWLQVLCSTFDKVEFKSVQRFVFSSFIYEIQSFQSQYLITIRQVNCFKIVYHCVADNWLRTTDYLKTIPVCVYVYQSPFQFCAIRIRLCMIFNSHWTQI